MKKSLLTILALGFMFTAQAQNTLKTTGGKTIASHAIQSLKEGKFSKNFQQKIGLHQFAISGDVNGVYKPASKAQNTGPEASASLTAGTWTQLENVDNHSKQLIAVDHQFGAGAHVDIRLLNSDISVAKTISLSIPDTANGYSISSGISNFSFEGNTKTKFIMYLHYFEGGMGPDYQKNAIWIFDEDGNILKKIDNTTFAEFVKNDDNTTGLFGYIGGDDAVSLRIYDQNLEQIADKNYSPDLFNFFMGAPVSLINIDGEQKIVVARYEKLFMDNATMEVYPDNHVIIEIFDEKLNPEKEITLPLPAHEEGSDLYAFGEFGVFYGNNKYDVTSHVFNTDNQLELLYSINYQDLMNDAGWRYFYVADEQGNILESYEKNVIDLYQMKEIQGQDDQMGFILADDAGNQSIDMFNIPDFNTVYNFPAVYNGEQLSGFFNRIPAEGSYQYLISLADPLKIGENYFGVLNKYSPAGEFVSNVKLNIGPAPLFFNPILYDDTLDPKVFNNDDDMEYNYVYIFKNEGDEQNYNSFNVAKDSQNPILSVNGGGEHGNVSASGFLLDNNNKPYKLAVVYGEVYDDIKYTEFFDLPFANMATSEVNKNQVSVYTDAAQHILGFTEKVKSYKVYNISGQLIRQGGEAKEVSTQGWTKGVYVVQYQTQNVVATQKVLIP